MAKFLVVDDDPAAVRALARLLEGDGHEVRSFTEGAQAVEAMAREPFDAVLTDLDMPHVNGAKVVRAARLHAPGACVVVASGHPHKNRLLEAGACVVYDKPIDYETIVSGIAACHARGGLGESGVCPATTQPGQGIVK